MQWFSGIFRTCTIVCLESKHTKAQLWLLYLFLKIKYLKTIFVFGKTQKYIACCTTNFWAAFAFFKSSSYWIFYVLLGQCSKQSKRLSRQFKFARLLFFFFLLLSSLMFFFSSSPKLRFFFLSKAKYSVSKNQN